MDASDETRRRQSLFWALQLGGWGLFGAGMFAAGVSQWPVLYALVVKSSLTLFGFLASLGLRTIYRGLARRRAPLRAAAGVGIPLCFGAAGLWMAAHNFVVAAFTGWQRAMPGLALRGFPDFVNTIYYFFLLLAWSALYFAIPAYLDLERERERVRRVEGLAQEARLRALRLQLNPHFLFNTLNAISTLVSEGKTTEANRMIGRLSHFLRVTLDRTDAHEIPLAEEIDFTCQYLEIEEVRFGSRLRVEITVAPEAEAALVPPLILQPLVENAVRHAVVPREQGGAIKIAAARRDGWLTVSVDDDGPGLEGPADTGRGVGLSNARERLAELYGEGAALELGRSVGGGLSVLVRLPFRASAVSAP